MNSPHFQLIASFVHRHRAFTAATALGFVLLLARWVVTWRGVYLFFVWNLFLAWLPLLFATLALAAARQTRPVATWSYAFLWLLFFPNAPYLVTDLTHWYPRPPVSRWVDLLLCLHFAWLGLALGFASLRLLEAEISDRHGRRVGWGFVTVTLGLASFGIYLGRVGRWNSWDIIVQPIRLSTDVVRQVVHPLAHWRTWEFTLICAVFLLCAYWVGVASATISEPVRARKNFSA